MSRAERVMPAHAGEQRRLVARDSRWAAYAAAVLAVLCLAAAVGHLVGSAARGGEPSRGVVVGWAIAAVFALVPMSFAMFAQRLTTSLCADHWAAFYARYVRVAWWHRRPRS